MMAGTSALQDPACTVLTQRRSVSSTCPLSHAQLACSHQYCAFPLNGNELCVWRTDSTHEQSLILKGHHQAITAVAIKHDVDDWIACSASEDYVIIWNLNDCRQASLQGLLPRGIVIGALLGNVQHLAFHPYEKLVAVCAGTKVFILNGEKEEILADVEVHLAPVTAAEFWHDGVIVCISEDRTFSVWNYCTEQLVYRSGIISAFPLLNMHIDVENDQLVTGCADGVIRVFSLSNGHNFRDICHIDLQKEKLKFCTMLDKSRQSSDKMKLPLYNKSLGDVKDSGLPILHIQKHEQYQQETYLPHLGTPVFLWIGSSTDLILINITTSDVETVFHFPDYGVLGIHLAGSISISSECGAKVFCLAASMFGNQVSLLELDAHALWNLQQCEQYSCDSGGNLSVISSDPLLSTSPLYCERSIKHANPKTIALKAKIKDQPLVFNNKIKSSGYTSAPRMKMFSPKTNIKTSQCSKIKREVPSGLIKEYPLDAQAPSSLHKQIAVSNKPTSACAIQYSGDGMKLACGLSDKSLLVFNSSLNGEPAIFTGHNGAVNGLGWSYDRNLLVSTADDRTLRIWNVKNADCALVLGKEVFSKQVRFPQFYYMDKFILLISGAEIQVLRYHLYDCKDEIKRYKQKNTWKIVQKLPMDSAVEITGLSAVNDFFSYIVLAAGSNRVLEVFDLNVGSRIAKIPDIHPRAAHQICQNKGSAFSTQQSEAYNLFATMAIGDSLKLWDIRTLRCVRRFEGHVNRYQPCGMAISPCGRFIACGSEDRCAYIYETRSNTYVQKLSKHTESVINVAYHPSSVQLTTCTLDGNLQIFVP